MVRARLARRGADARRATARGGRELAAREGPGRVRHEGPARRRSERSDQTRGPALAAGELADRRVAGASSTRARSTRSTATSRRTAVTSCVTTSSTSAPGWARPPATSRARTRAGSTSVEIGRTLATVLSLGLYRRPYQSQRGRLVRDGGRSTRRSAGIPAETFDVEAFRTNRKVPAHKRMTDRDAYWGAKVVTSFTDAQLAAVAAVGAPGRGRDDVPRPGAALSAATSSAGAT